jgi:ribosomal protein L29
VTDIRDQLIEARDEITDMSDAELAAMVRNLTAALAEVRTEQDRRGPWRRASAGVG